MRIYIASVFAVLFSANACAYGMNADDRISSRNTIRDVHPNEVPSAIGSEAGVKVRLAAQYQQQHYQQQQYQQQQYQQQQMLLQQQRQQQLIQQQQQQQMLLEQQRQQQLIQQQQRQQELARQ